MPQQAENNLHKVLGLVIGASSLAGVFVSIFIYTHSDAATTFLYRLISFCLLLFWMMVSGWVLKRLSVASAIRIALLVAVVQFLSLFYLKEQAVNWVVFLGILDGTVAGLFWSAYNLAQYVLTHKGARIGYFAKQTGMLNIVQALAPLLGGALVSGGNAWIPGWGYGLLFGVVIIVLVGGMFWVGKLPTISGLRFSIFDVIHHGRTKQWWMVLGLNFLVGLYDVAFGTVSGILVYLVVRQELWLGSSKTLAFGLGVVGSLLVKRVMKRWKYSFWAGCLGLVVGIVGFALWQNVFGVLWMSVFTGLFAPFFGVWMARVYFDAVDVDTSEWQDKYRYLWERDVVLGLARVLSFIGLYYWVQGGDPSTGSGLGQVAAARNVLWVIPLIPLLIGIVGTKIEKANL